MSSRRTISLLISPHNRSLKKEKRKGAQPNLPLVMKDYTHEGSHVTLLLFPILGLIPGWRSVTRNRLLWLQSRSHRKCDQTESYLFIHRFPFFLRSDPMKPSQKHLRTSYQDVHCGHWVLVHHDQRRKYCFLFRKMNSVVRLHLLLSNWKSALRDRKKTENQYPYYQRHWFIYCTFSPTLHSTPSTIHLHCKDGRKYRLERSTIREEEENQIFSCLRSETSCTLNLIESLRPCTFTVNPIELHTGQQQ